MLSPGALDVVDHLGHDASRIRSGMQGGLRFRATLFAAVEQVHKLLVKTCQHDRAASLGESAAHPWPYCSMLSGTCDAVGAPPKSFKQSKSRDASVRLTVLYAVAGSGAGSSGSAPCSWSWNTVRRPCASAGDSDHGRYRADGV